MNRTTGGLAGFFSPMKKRVPLVRGQCCGNWFAGRDCRFFSLTLVLSRIRTRVAGECVFPVLFGAGEEVVVVVANE